MSLSFGPSSRRLRVVLLGLLAGVTCLPATGCVRRRLTIRSNPPGAMVYVDDQEIGFTPVSTPFTYYGTRKFQVVKDGYETLTVKQKFKTPWYQVPPLDFVSENFWPGEIRDERAVDFQLEPQRIVPTQELIGRAQNLRNSAMQGYVPTGPNRAPPQETIFPPSGAAPPNASSYPAVPPGERRFEPLPARTPVQRPFYP